MKRLLFLGACLVALASSPALAQTGGVDVVVVRVYEAAGELRMAVSRGEGKTEMLQFPAGRSEKSQLNAAEAYQILIAKLYQQGYSLKSTVTVESGLVAHNTASLIFVKEK